MKSQTQILAIDLTNRENFKKTSLLEIGTKAKVSLPGALLSTDRENTFRKECLHFYVAAASYLKFNLPFDISLFKHSQYLQPEKRNLSGSTNTISNLAFMWELFSRIIFPTFPMSIQKKNYVTKYENSGYGIRMKLHQRIFTCLLKISVSK